MKRRRTRGAAGILAAGLSLVVLAASGTSQAHPAGEGVGPDAVVGHGPLGEVYLATGETYQPHEVTVDVHGVKLSLPEYWDLKTMAEEGGADLADVIERWAWTPRFVDVSNRLQDEFPESFAGSAILNDGLGARIGFKGDVPPLAHALIADLPVTVNLMAGLGYSEAELEAVLIEVSEAIFARDDVASGSGTYDTETGVITIEVQPAASLHPDQREQFIAELQPAAPANPHIQVQIQLGTVEIVQAHHLHGGGHFLKSGGVQHCTAGFSVVTGGLFGMSTAGHCARDHSRLWYQRHGDGTVGTAMDRKKIGSSSYGDMAWYNTPNHLSTARFYHSWSSLRTVKGVKRPVEGDKLCYYGRVSGTRCDLKVTNVSRSGKGTDGVTYHRLVETTMENAIRNGDSGGPWYRGNTAYGITMGWRVTALGNRRPIFTPAANFPTGMGVRVITG